MSMVSAAVRILDDLVVDQIAAGEVVERPVSVVKELVENSLDAGARNISVVIANGGHSFIEVIDDGAGMTRENALVAVKRFGTSKIRNVDDLRAIGSLGFRGEALPSIASVSRFRIATSTDAGPGVNIEICGGELIETVDAAMPRGTRVEVRQLFYNVPARRKFLKSERTEANLIRSLLLDFSAAYPTVRFVLIHEGNEVLNVAAAEDFFARAAATKLAGKDAIRIERSVETSIGHVRLRALLSRPAEAIQGSTRLRLIVNGRIVRDRLLLRAVSEGYSSMVKPGRYPGGVLCIEVPPEEVDVNVHPQKAEVRFANPQAVFLLTAQAIRTALSSASVIDGTTQFDVSKAEPFLEARSPEVQFIPPMAPERQLALVPELKPNLPAAPAVRDTIALAALRFVGQVFRCYLLLEAVDELLVVDMHAAHERICFNRIKEQLACGALPRQALLLPQVVELPAVEYDRFEALNPLLSRFGFECDSFGEGAVVIRSIPSLLLGCNPQQVLQDLISLPQLPEPGQAMGEAWDAAIARLACHGSIRSGRELEREEVYALLEELDRSENRAFCPHGRPIVRGMRLGELESVFARS